MLPDPVLRLAQRLDASYTEELVRLHRARTGGTPATPVIAGPISDRPAAGTRVAVVVHVFYPELLGQLRRAVENLPPGTDVFVSVPDEAVRDQAFAQLGGREVGLLDVRIVENRGRDIAPKYVAFADVYRRGYGLLLFLHTKKSLTADFGDDWRDQLFRSLVGSPAIVNGIIELFRSDAALGVIAPSHHPSIGSTTGWDGNYPAARRLARRAGLTVHRWSPPDFPSGSMFWARPQALTPLTGVGLGLDDFPPEHGQVGVTIMHALERMVFVAAAHAGFRAVMVTDPVNPAAVPAVASEQSPARRTAPAPGPILHGAAAVLATVRLVRSVVRRAVVPAMRAPARVTGAAVKRSSRGALQRQ